MYDIGRKTGESSSTSLTEIDDLNGDSLATTSSASSVNDVKISPVVIHQQSQFVQRKQQEQRQGKSFIDVVAMLRQSGCAPAEGAQPTHGPKSRSLPLDPDATAQAFRKALRTNCSMNQSKRVIYKFIVPHLE
jgi:hypothetical protein